MSSLHGFIITYYGGFVKWWSLIRQSIGFFYCHTCFERIIIFSFCLQIVGKYICLYIICTDVLYIIHHQMLTCISYLRVYKQIYMYVFICFNYFVCILICALNCPTVLEILFKFKSYAFVTPSFTISQNPCSQSQLVWYLFCLLAGFPLHTHPYTLTKL